MHYKSAVFVILGVIYHVVYGLQDVRIIIGSGCIGLIVVLSWVLYSMASGITSLGFSIKDVYVEVSLRVLYMGFDIIVVFSVVVLSGFIIWALLYVVLSGSVVSVVSSYVL